MATRCRMFTESLADGRSSSVGQLQQLGHCAGAAGDFGRRAACHAQAVVEVLTHRHVGEDRIVLEDEADAAPAPSARPPCRGRRTGCARSVGCSMPAIMFIVVDLPQPEGPSRAMNSPSAMVRSMVFSAVKAPNRLTRFSRRIALMPRTSAARAIRFIAQTAEDRQRDQDRQRDGRDIAPDQVLRGDLVDVDADRLGRDAWARRRS